MRIGINASFLRKPETGIGQLTCNFVQKLQEFPISNPPAGRTGFQFPINDLNDKNETKQEVSFVLYTEEPIDLKLPENFTVRSFLPFWKRDDLIRKVLWERQVAKEAEKDGCDVFFSLYQSSTFFSKMRHVMLVHDIIPHLFPSYQGNFRQKMHWKLVEEGIRRASSLLTVSLSTKNDLVRFGIKEENIEIVSPGISPLFSLPLLPTEETRVLEKYQLEAGYLYHGGGLEVRKNTEKLLRAYQILVEQEQTGELRKPLPPLVISGTIFSEENKLATPVRKLVEELRLGERVRLLDFVPREDLPALYKNALFFAYPSLYEGFGLPVLEALSLGTPVLVGNNSSLPEVARDAGLLVDAESIDSIALGMKRLLEEDTLRATLRGNAPAVCRPYSWVSFRDGVLSSLLVSSRKEVKTFV